MRAKLKTFELTSIHQQLPNENASYRAYFTVVSFSLQAPLGNKLNFKFNDSSEFLPEFEDSTMKLSDYCISPIHIVDMDPKL